jgi:hypothetical protein
MLTTDITANRHKNNPESIDANKRIEPTKADWRKRIALYMNCVGGDWTLKELCRAFDKSPNEISGRLSEMKASGILEPTGERREGCAVLRLTNNR